MLRKIQPCAERLGGIAGQRGKTEEDVDEYQKIELFARRKAEGFDVWGNEVDSDIEFKGGNRLCS